MKALSVPSMLFLLSSLLYNNPLAAQTGFPLGRSELIVEGEIVSSECVLTQQSNNIYTVHKLEVKRLYKGTLKNKYVYITTFGGEVGNQFQSMSHNIKIGKGTSGIFFLWKNSLNLREPYDREDLYFPVDGNDGIVRFYDDRVNPPATFKRKVISNLKEQIYKPLIMATGQVNEMDDFTGSFSLRSSIPSIRYSFKDAELTGIYNDTLEFDVYAELIPDGAVSLLGIDEEVLFANAKIFVDYDSASFGSNLAQSGHITIQKGELIQPSDYSVSLVDSTAQKLEVDISSVPHSKYLSTLTEDPVQLLHVKIAIANYTQWVLVDFDEVAMQPYSDYYDSTNQIYHNFYSVETSGRLIYQIPEDGSAVAINYQFANQQIVGTNPKRYSFDIVAFASDPNTKFSHAFINFLYNTSAFGNSVAANMKVTAQKGGIISDSIYELIITDHSNEELKFVITPIQVDPNKFAIMPTSPTTLISVELEIKQCNETAGLVFNDTFMQDRSLFYTGDSILPFTLYDPVIASSVDSAILCPDSLPTIYAMDPLRIPAGTWDTLTITGANFGTDTGMVWFKNADSPSVFGRVYNSDIKMWSDSVIRVVVPGTLFPSAKAPGKGPVKVETNGGIIATFNNLDIPYCNSSYRTPGGFRSRYILIDSGGYALHPNSNNFVPVSNAVPVFTAALRQWQCLTGLHMFVDSATGVAVIDDDTINVIMFADSAYFASNYGANVLAVTFSSGHDVCDIGGQVLVRQVWDVDMIFNSGIDWYMDTVGGPGYTQYDFYSVALHELGHAHLLDHALGSEKAMYKSISDSQTVRILHSDDVAGGREISSDFEIMNLSNCISAFTTQNYESEYPPGCTGMGLAGTTGFEKITLYPNPTADYLQIISSRLARTQETVSIRVINLAGETLLERKYDVSSSRRIDVSHLMDGIYLLVIQYKDDFHVDKFIKIGK